jgi:hypothetical protein
MAVDSDDASEGIVQRVTLPSIPFAVAPSWPALIVLSPLKPAETVRPALDISPNWEGALADVTNAQQREALAKL